MIKINNKKIKLVKALFLVIGIIFPVGFLMDFVTDKVAFPIMFTCIGCQQLFNGLISENKSLKILSISFGILMIIFVVFRVIPNYYFK